ncbi:CoA-disulfide reductase [Halanaerobium hydrogeniformans]|uniref:FAD-dependent pyridine nucleotide-disulfide oxidoreductase n=1 Tax=Halanaerobium hydrogeniformans TaxID=656519 RepID=E4RJ27_HALHG|nr:CoA-disulfide reductase [Halanaerobium hydrogeniformans]ADQ15247.1 FAD-dependent pyridine nucleotide-disulfide oxidoreductase [Halanaerobium hydrogeniformans]
MGKKVIIVGGVAGGASTAARLRRMSEDTEIIMLEKGEYISFANCGLPYHIGEVIEKREELLVQTPEAMKARFNIDVRIMHEALDIDRKEKNLKIKNLETGNIYTESYDKLVLSPGADPIKPPLPGLDIEEVYTLRNIRDMDLIKEYIDNNEIKHAVVVGGGFIGLEMLENLHQRGLKVSLLELTDQVMRTLDKEMVSMVHNHMRTKGVDLNLSDGIAAVEKENGKKFALLQSGKRIETDLIILSIGVKPKTELAEKAGLDIGVSGGIKVNQYLQTSDPNIYAIGDAIEVKDFVINEPSRIPLAGPANKQGRIAANNITGRKEKYNGTQGTSIAKIFDIIPASTGAAEKKLKENDFNYQVVHITSNNHASYYPGALPMMLKLIYQKKDGRILGAQIVGFAGVDKRIDVLSTAIRHQMNIFDLQELELAYSPPFGSAKDPVNMLGFAAGNIYNGLVKPAFWQELDELDNEEIILLDIRENIELELGQIPNSIHIPLNSLRDRLDELDKDKEYITYCAVGLRGYIAARILMQNGFNKVRNLSGGYKLYKAVMDDKNEVIEKEEEAELNSLLTPEDAEMIADLIIKNIRNK